MISKKPEKFVLVEGGIEVRNPQYDLWIEAQAELLKQGLDTARLVHTRWDGKQYRLVTIPILEEDYQSLSEPEGAKE